MADDEKNRPPANNADAAPPSAPAGEGTKPAAEASEEGKPPFPSLLPVLPSREIVLFPDMVIPLLINTPRDAALV
ncbi:MAG: hypothetical protein N3A66_02460, partial [Planctomycetota bacterium]|nr:hypothetical protein [Planctomycetota bacterium]